MTDLASRTALVTGASRGIGRATARALAAAGARVIVHYGNAARGGRSRWSPKSAPPAERPTRSAPISARPTAPTSSRRKSARSSANGSTFSSPMPASQRRPASRTRPSRNSTACSPSTSARRSSWCSNCCRCSAKAPAWCCCRRWRRALRSGLLAGLCRDQGRDRYAGEAFCGAARAARHSRQRGGARRDRHRDVEIRQDRRGPPVHALACRRCSASVMPTMSPTSSHSSPPTPRAG